MHILVEGVPYHIHHEEAHQSILDISAKQEVHDLHIWAIDSHHVALTAHLVVEKGLLENTHSLIEYLQNMLATGFKSSIPPSRLSATINNLDFQRVSIRYRIGEYPQTYS